jgi:hypothetical protein
VPGPHDDHVQRTHPLSSWYATVLFWRPQVALLVDEETFLPALLPLAPAATLLTRVPDVLETLLTAHGVPTRLRRTVTTNARRPVLRRTASRQVVGVMNEFVLLATPGAPTYRTSI